MSYESPCQYEHNRSFLNFVEKAVVHEQNLDTWKFGKGALSGKSWGVAVLQSCGAAVEKGKESRRLEAEEEMSNDKGERLRLRLRLRLRRYSKQ